ncbi:MAG: AHH domain-containing protein [Chloroflexi bacterium]|nr:AHH domain-containing protein [Chloroflexota bacterium]
MDGETTLFVGSYYEQKGSQVTKYYFAGSTRIAMRKYTIPQSMSVEYFLGDHLGSTSITTDANGAKTSELRYKPWGEIRYAWTASLSTSPAYELTKYTYTGQYSHMDDPSTAGITEGFGLMFYNARWYDPSLGRFAQADTIVPVQSQGVQAWDRYAYANNNPIRNTDPTGHWIESVVDIAFIAYDIYDISQNGLNWENGLSLAADVAGLALPFVTGGGLLVRAATHADDVAKAINTADNIIDTANAIDNAIDAGNAADNLADGIKLANDVPCSFSAETDVATPDGAKDIAAIEIGDYVLAWNEADGTLGYYEVTAVMSHADEVLVELILDGEWIETTPEHPFYVKGKGWTPAEDLRMGDEIRQADGTTGRVWLTWTVYRTQAMYNLTVDTAHTFFVGEGQWLVHNACSSATLSNNLGGGIGDNLQAHHVIPCEYACHPFVERAKNSGWSMDEAYNGILLPDNIQLSKQLDLPVHNGPHPGYSGAVGNTLDQLERLAYRNNWSDNKAFQQLRNLADTLKTEIRNIGGGVWLR